LENTFLRAGSWVALPFSFDNELTGVICLSHGEPKRFNPKNLCFCRDIVQQAIQAHFRLYERLQKTAIQEERQRMARELHDSVTQVFYGIQLEANTALSLLLREQGQSSEVSQQLDQILQLAEAGLAEMRALLFELRPESLEREGLVAALQKQIGILQVRYKLKIEANLGEEPKIPDPAKEALYRIAQEALNNVVKHARASRVELNLFQQPGYVILQVRDDGCGFQPETRVPGHYGLTTMHERARLVNATLDVISQPEQGTQIRVFIPTK
jgi:signal transduction histidine kinase